MPPRSHLLGLAAAAALVGFAPRASACTPARVGASVSSQPEPWRRAVAGLVAASATSGNLWSCSGGTVDLVAHEGGATLTVVSDDGHEVSRDVGTPEEVEPLGEALLARPLVAPALVESPVAEVVPDRVEPAPAGDAPPRAYISAIVAPRYVGNTDVVWGGVTAAASLPFLDRWNAGAWVRYDAVTGGLSRDQGPISEFCFGASAGRTFPFKRLELRTNLLASVAVVTRGQHHDDDKMTGARHMDPAPDETRVDGRIGAEVRAAIPILPWLRAVVALDGELVPRELDHSAPPPNGLSRYPSFTLGLGVGMELAPR